MLFLLKFFHIKNYKIIKFKYIKINNFKLYIATYVYIICKLYKLHTIMYLMHRSLFS